MVAGGKEGARVKPLLTAGQQVARLKARGVTFDLMGEDEAVAFLEFGNNYLRTASYRKLYPRQAEGARKGDYVNLDFADLRNLSSLDRRLRRAFLAMAIDVEHFAKMRVLREAESRGEDGYGVIADFTASLNHAGRNAMWGVLDRRSRDDEGRDAYAGDLIAHYRDGMPLWVLLEVLEFGRFLTLYKFCAGRWDDNVMLQEHYALKSVKALRNACAHNHCVLNGLVQGAEPVAYTTPKIITQSLNEAGVQRSKSRRAKLANLRIAQMAATLYCLQALCVRESTLRHHAASLADLRARYEENIARWRLNSSLASYWLNPNLSETL